MNANSRANMLIKLGLLLIAVALVFCGYNLGADRHAAHAAATAAAQLQAALPPADSTPPTAEPADYELYPEMEMPTAQVVGVDYIGVLKIAALDLQLPIAADWSDTALRESPCRYSGSAYTDDLVIAGHNYAAHFGRLHELSIGAAVTLTDMDGNRFAYQVGDVEVLPATAIDEMCDSDWELTLFTCTIGGQNRLAIRCAPAQD